MSFESAEKLQEMFDIADGVDLVFDEIENKLSGRQDLHAFLLLEKILPGKTGDMISAAEHDQIFLGVDLDELVVVITQEQVNELEACGVWIWESEGLAMFA